MKVFKANNLLKKEREESGLTLREMSTEIGLHYSYLSGVENQSRNVKEHNAILITKFFGRPLLELFDIYGIVTKFGDSRATISK